MIVDFDDFSERDNRLDLLEALHGVNSSFRCTLFAIPALGSDSFWASVPSWCELAVHGWEHSSPMEAAAWSYEQAMSVIDRRPGRFVEGFKAPGWQVSDETYRAIMDSGWWIADHWENDCRRPSGIVTHVISRECAELADPKHWHGHIGNVCGNGIEETFAVLRERVRETESFELMSEVVAAW